MRRRPKTSQICDNMIIAKAYALHDGGDVVSSWYAQYGRWPKITTKLDLKMIHLLQQNRDGWTRPHYDTLRDGVGEIRFKAKGILYRPLGYFGPNRNDFTFLLFVTKRDEFDPPNAIDIAVERRIQIEQSRAGTVEINRWKP